MTTRPSALVLSLVVSGLVACGDAKPDAPLAQAHDVDDASTGAHTAEHDAGHDAGTDASIAAADPTADMTLVPASPTHLTFDFFIDPYEATIVDDAARSVAGVIPTVSIDFATADLACTKAGKRLCTYDEWLAACEGPFDLALGFQEDPLSPPVSTVCDTARTTNNTPGSLPSETGSHPKCKTKGLDLWDMIGNASEWTRYEGRAFPSGVAFYMSEEGTSCELGLSELDGSEIPPSERDTDIGFRCCADAK